MLGMQVQHDYNMQVMYDMVQVGHIARDMSRRVDRHLDRMYIIHCILDRREESNENVKIQLL